MKADDDDGYDDDTWLEVFMTDHHDLKLSAEDTHSNVGDAFVNHY